MEITIKTTKEELDALESHAGRIMQIGRKLKAYQVLEFDDADKIFELGSRLEEFFNSQQPISKLMARNKELS